MARRVTLEPVVSKLEKFILYQTHSHMYVVGCDKRQVAYRVLKVCVVLLEVVLLTSSSTK